MVETVDEEEDIVPILEGRPPVAVTVMFPDTATNTTTKRL